MSQSVLNTEEAMQIQVGDVLLPGSDSESLSKAASRGTVYEQLFDHIFQHLSTPVEFQLPQCLIKEKASLYTYIKRNVYLTKKTRTRIDDDGIFCSCGHSSGSSSACGTDCLCGALLSSCSQNCKCGGKCLNKPFQHRRVKKMKLVQTEKCGSGIIADEDIKQGEFIVEYVGEVIDDKTCEERLWRMKHGGETNFYLCEINRDMVIDATFKGNKSRYINHSCKPNTEMQKWTINGETRIGIFATRNIKKGDDLTYDYQFVQFGADQDCYCGADGCRKKLGSKLSKLKASNSNVDPQGLESASGFKSENVHVLSPNGNVHLPNCVNAVIRVWCPTNNRYVGGVISGFDARSRRHYILTEDGEHQIIDLSTADWDIL
ncbi:histone-lysine N-methyltransferase ASHH3-like isoform X2 [Wolffia australiana]